MKILFMSNMYPSEEKPYAGIFVRNQYEMLSKIIGGEDQLDIFYMPRKFTSKFGSVLKYSRAFLKFTPFIFKNYDIVHVHYFYPLIIFAWLKKQVNPRTKIVVTFLGRDVNAQVNSNNKFLFRTFAKRIDYSIPVGKTLAKQIESKLNLHKYKILPCGVDEDIFYQDKGIKKKYDFIFIGSFIYRKGIDTVIEAIKRLPKELNVKFCFCGSGNYEAELIQLSKYHNIEIKQNQTQNQLRVLLNQSRFFLLMSRSEGFATATTEAFFCGIPVLTSDIDNFQEQVIVGHNGYLSPLENVDTLTKNITRLYKTDTGEYEILSNNALNSLKNASLRSVCNEIFGVYNNLVQDK